MTLQKIQKPLVFAHRGASGYEYENSFSAFDKAIEQGADGLETDAWILTDGEIVLHHDKGVKIPDQDAPTNISKMTLDEIKAFDLPNGDKIPTLDEFLSRYHSKKSSQGVPLQFSIDLQDLNVGKAMLPVLEKYNVLNRSYLCSATSMVMKRIRKENQDALLVATNLQDRIQSDNLQPDSKLGQLNLFAFNVKASSFKPEMGIVLKSSGLNLFLWDLHSEENLRQYIHYNPYACYSNYPDLAIKIRDEIFSEE